MLLLGLVILISAAARLCLESSESEGTGNEPAKGEVQDFSIIYEVLCLLQDGVVLHYVAL